MGLSRGRIGVLIVAIALLCVPLNVSGADSNEQYVFEYVVQPAAAGLDEIVPALKQAAEAGGWQVLSVVETTLEKHDFRSVVLALVHPAHLDAVMGINGDTAPFVAVDRINVFEDENGVSVSVNNPLAMVRTVLLSDTANQSMAADHLAALRELVTGAVQGTVVNRGYGQLRDRGLISKTMGVVAGGPFDEKIEQFERLKASNLADVIAKLQSATELKTKKWGMFVAYTLELPDGRWLVGTTGMPMAVKSFDIVGEGTDASRGDFAFPGLAHAGAYPIEMVLAQEGEDVMVYAIDDMFRMKMYFEDAGKWAFMKNMGMPSSIANDMAYLIEDAMEAEQQ
jgi:hypothetical protein